MRGALPLAYLTTGLAAAASGQARPIRGFPADALAERSRLEAVLRETPDTALLRRYMRAMTDAPHDVGRPGSKRVAEYALGRLAELPWVRSYGPAADRRAGIVSFNVEGVHPHDVAQVLDFEGVAIRAGHHCCQPLMRKLGVAATNRASFYVYTIPDEIDRLVDGLHKVKKAFG